MYEEVYFQNLQKIINDAKEQGDCSLDDIGKTISHLGPIRQFNPISIDSKYNIFFQVDAKSKDIRNIDIDRFCQDYNLSHEIKSDCVEFCPEGSNKRIAYIVYDPHTIAIDISFEKAPELLQNIGDTFFELRY